MTTIDCHAGNVRKGDTVTGIWDRDMTRCSPVHLDVRDVTAETAPNGERLTTIHHGPQSWQQHTYCSDTVVRVRTQEAR